MFKLVFTRRYSMAHRLISGCSVKCATPHGHNEFVTVEIVGDATPLDLEVNMVAEFAQAKTNWHRWIDDHVDHAFQLSDQDPLLGWAEEHGPSWRLVVTPGDPTTEMLAALFMAKLNAFLAADGHGLSCREVKIEETPTNTVTFAGDWRAHLPHSADGQYWWERADFTTHDLPRRYARAATGALA